MNKWIDILFRQETDNIFLHYSAIVLSRWVLLLLTMARIS